MHNAPPYGYRYIPVGEVGGGQWVTDEREAEAVRQIFAWYTGQEKLTIWQITQRLDHCYAHALRRAQRWQHSIVDKILTRTAFIGRTYFNRERILPETIGTPRTTGRGKRRTAQCETRPKEEWIEVSLPPLVDVAIWERAQERLKMNQKFAARNNQRHFYLLRGLLVCATCGHTLQGRSQQGRVYYDCEHGGKNRYPHGPRHTCHVAGHTLEPLVWEAIAELLSHPDRMAAAWEAEASGQDPTPDELDRLQARERKLTQQWIRLVDAFQDGLLEKTELAQRKQRLDQERAAIAERVEQIQCQQEQPSAKAQIMQRFALFCEQTQRSLADPTPEAMQEVLRLLVESIMVEEDAITIKHIIPTNDT
jgi:site-specific DNA recombinase